MKVSFCKQVALLPLLLLLMQVLSAQPIKPERLGTAINTDGFDESAPTFSADGNVMYFWSLERPDGVGLQDIYYSTRDSATGVWSDGLNLGRPLNDPTCNIAFALTPDNTTMLVYRQGTSKNNSDLAISKRTTAFWGAPVPLRFEHFENLAQSGITAYLGADGKTLLLSIIGPDTRGKEDLYVSTYDKKLHTFTTPKSLGKLINTPGSDITPFLAPDGITLYYSTDSLPGRGGLDIYMTRRLDDSWQNWSRPINLGPQINSSGDEYYFKFPADAKLGYYVSNNGTPTKDIWQVNLPPYLRPLPVMLVKGKVYNQATKQTMLATISYQELPSGIEVGSAQTDTTTGEYRILLPAGKQYGFMATAAGCVAVSENITVTLPPGKPYAEQQRDLTLAPLQAGQSIRLNNLFFATGSAAISAASYPELKRVAELLQMNPSLSIEVGGYTDNIGSLDLNLQLSHNRAEAVRKYLVETLHADAARISVLGYGSNFAVADNSTEEGRRLNRRVEMKIVTLGN